MAQGFTESGASAACAAVSATTSAIGRLPRAALTNTTPTPGTDRTPVGVGTTFATALRRRRHHARAGASANLNPLSSLM